MHALVIGAGVIGASTAYRLARGGAGVTLLERGRIGGGTSAASFAWTNANKKTPRAYHDLNVEGIRVHAALRTEFGGTPWWHGGGNVLVAAGDAGRDAVRRQIERLRAWDYAAEEITAARLHELEPDIPPSVVRDATIAFFPDEGWVETTVYVHAMVQAAVAAGARVLTGTGVREIQRTGDRVTGVRTESGDVHAADVVVNCAGRWAGDLGASAGLDIPLAPNRSVLAITPPALTRLARVIHAPACQVRPDGGGRVMVQADDVDDAVTASGAAEPPPDLAADLVRRAADLLPGLAGTGVESARIGIRAMPADGYSIIGPHGGVSGYYVVVTHSGVTLAPFLGAAAAAEILTGRPDERLAPFRADRFGTPSR
jgi:glycine/D-amino acid oxidase-like deaminating enzyme